MLTSELIKGNWKAKNIHNQLKTKTERRKTYQQVYKQKNQYDARFKYKITSYYIT